MAMTLMTAIIIANNTNLIYTHAGPDKHGKYMGWITMGEDDYCRPLVNTEAIFESAEEAEKHMYVIRDHCINKYKEDEL